jgi:heme exporter protein A
MILQAENIACRRGERLLFEGVNFQLQAGELLLLEGRNGCGKTTLLRTLALLRQSDVGQIQWNNQPIEKLAEQYLSQLTWMGHHNALKGDLSALDNLDIQCRLHGLVCSDTQRWDALEQIGLYGYEDLPTRVLSQGQKRRASLAYLLLSQAPLWILDEPFSALDIAAVDLLQSIMQKHVNQGGMLILTTHQEVALTSNINRLRLDAA